MNTKLKILVCPLDWGLGHATRVVPIIRALLEREAEVIIAADKGSGAFLKGEFPNLKHIQFKGYEIEYAKGNGTFFKILSQIPRILKRIAQEQRELKNIVNENNIDLVISDNRYGLWWNQSENPDNKVYTVFMTHQLHAKLPSFWKIFAPLFHRFTKRTLKRFDECWIPDIESENNLSGALSHPPISDAANNKRIIIDYIGPLSRFSRHARQTKKYNQVFILSGPEPQRTIFEEIILAQLENTVEKSLVVRGMPENMNIEKYSEHVDLASHMETEELNEIILAADLIVTRAGYSSIMDLAVMNRTAVLVPTPGQREQEYLAAYLMEKGFYYSENQDSFNLLRATRESKNYKGIDITDNKVVLRTRIGRLLERLISGTNLVSSEL